VTGIKNVFYIYDDINYKLSLSLLPVPAILHYSVRFNKWG